MKSLTKIIKRLLLALRIRKPRPSLLAESINFTNNSNWIQRIESNGQLTERLFKR